MIYAIPRLVMTAEVSVGHTRAEPHAHCLFIGMSSSRIGPYAPKISLRWDSFTFLVSFSTTICDCSAVGRSDRVV